MLTLKNCQANYIHQYNGTKWIAQAESTSLGGVTAQGGTAGFFSRFRDANSIENSTMQNTGGGLLVQGQQGAFDYSRVNNADRLMWIPDKKAFRWGQWLVTSGVRLR